MYSCSVFIGIVETVERLLVYGLIVSIGDLFFILSIFLRWQVNNAHNDIWAENSTAYSDGKTQLIQIYIFT
jgi:hypothetical protein